MSTKESLLQLLQANRGLYLSGQEIAGKLGISRAAVCKAVKSLRDQGVSIEAVTNRGYCLQEPPDLITEQAVRCHLTEDCFRISIFSSLPSTNSYLRDLASQGAPEGTVVIARQQTAGRGRMGRSFYSPEDTGLYMSLLLRPSDMSPTQSLQVTTTAAAALCLAIRDETGLEPRIKWVNDLYLNGKKICGILTEAALSLETGALDYAVLGLGLNLYPPKDDFPEELSSIAGYLTEQPEENLKARLAAGFLNHFWHFYSHQDFAAAGDIYRRNCHLIGKTVLVGVTGKKAQVLDITDQCRLSLQYENGETDLLSYGEVSIVNL